MQTFLDYESSTISNEIDLIDLLLNHVSENQIEIEDGYIIVNTQDSLEYEAIMRALPGDVEFDVYVSQHGILGVEYEDDDAIDWSHIDDPNRTLHILIYTDNMSDDEELDEVARKIKVNSKGARRIKMKCKKGFRFDGKKCVPIMGSEKTNRRRAIRKAVRTKKALGSGYQKRVVRLRKRAMTKRQAMGLK